MKLISIALLFFSASALANVEPGQYSGHDENGQVCQFEIGDAWFENNLPHPLNERIPVSGIQFAKVTLTQTQWNLQHPQVVDLKKGTARFDHDLLQSVIPTKSGALSLTLLKDDKEGVDGHKPLGIIYIEDNYRSPADSKKLVCNLN